MFSVSTNWHTGDIERNKVFFKINARGSSPRWRCTTITNWFLSTLTRNLPLHMEQLLLKEVQKLTKQHIKQMRKYSHHLCQNGQQRLRHTLALNPSPGTVTYSQKGTHNSHLLSEGQPHCEDFHLTDSPQNAYLWKPMGLASVRSIACARLVFQHLWLPPRGCTPWPSWLWWPAGFLFSGPTGL